MTGQSNAGGTPGCSFETALVNSRRRIPYSVGSDTLAIVPPGSYHSRLDEKDERCLSVDMMDLYHVSSHCSPEANFSNYYQVRILKNDGGSLLTNLIKS